MGAQTNRKIKAFDQADYEDMIVILQEVQLTIEALADRYEIAPRTVYRWLKYAETDGWDIIKRGTNPVRYELAVPKCQAS